MTRRDRQRVAVSVLVGASCFAISWVAANLVVGFDQDFAASIYSTRILLAHSNPYLERVGGNNGLTGTPWFYYPLPTALLLVPLVSMPVKLGGPVFAGVTSSILAFAVTRRAWWPLLIFSSAAALLTIAAANMSALLTAGILLPSMAWVGVFKPNIGLGILAYRPSWKAAVAMGVIAAASLLVMVDWPREWIANATHSRFHFSPWRVPGGIFIAPLALTRWRRPEARLLAMMATVPSSPIVYEALPLFLIPNTPRQMIWLAVLSDAAYLANAKHSLLVDPDAFLAIGRWSMVYLMYVPALALVLLRPNVGPLPQWLERASLRLPSWLRGRASDAMSLAK